MGYLSIDLIYRLMSRILKFRFHINYQLQNANVPPATKYTEPVVIFSCVI